MKKRSIIFRRRGQQGRGELTLSFPPSSKMCGIFGVHSFGLPLSAQVLDAPLRLLSHRGPDGSGKWLSSSRVVALGHRRLSIIDLEGGAQPLFNEDASVVAVVNGEFYGYRDTRQELEARGHRFRTKTDSEILIHLYEDFDVECVTRLRGEFAFLLWDERRNRLFAGRDRFGIKPLFYARSGTCLIFASEAKALFAAGLPAAWDLEAVHQHLQACIGTDRSLFQGVHQVPPGSYLVESSGKATIQQYWDADYPSESGRAGSFDIASSENALKSSLTDAVRTRLVADVPVGCMLSGGLDSSVVLSLARDAGAGGTDAFTVSFDSPDYDEVPRARQMAAYAEVALHDLCVRDDDMATHVADAIWHSESIGYNGQAVARYLLAREIKRNGIKVALAGEGADELFGGYVFSVRDAAHSARPASVHIADISRVREVDRRLGRVPSLLSGLAENRELLRRLLGGDFRARFRDRDPFAAMLDGLDTRRMRTWHPVHQSLYLWTKLMLPNYVLVQDRLDMAHGVEVRLPFFDHHLFDIVRTIPAALLVQGGIDKYVLRQLAAAWLPQNILRTPKHAFMAPPAAMTLGGRFMAWAQDTIRSQTMRDLPFFDHGAAVALLDSLPNLSLARRIAADPVLMTMCSLCVLQERYVVQRSSAMTIEQTSVARSATAR